MDGVNKGLFLLAIRISKGGRFPLAPLFVGCLYKRLDLYKGSMEALIGHSSVLCFVDIVALQLFLWDHYTGYAPEVVNGKVAFRAWLRCTPKPQANLLDVLDNEAEFSFHPYTWGISSHERLRLHPPELGST
ncbi:hypothetical protein CFOL_v3_24206 [Cephalotus follicularis]|uniref:PMD domain-containing protein n=1 Tax=Cephalotus follicularis TaxID=3775 RepID=A0A1Q3CKI2_CEPFO|nr:hypothetical protein CFOL_v3_24206 [Cephalotus follicularis]